jgi:hypothetical protein
MAAVVEGDAVACGQEGLLRAGGCGTVDAGGRSGGPQGLALVGWGGVVAHLEPGGVSGDGERARQQHKHRHTSQYGSCQPPCVQQKNMSTNT